MVEAIQIAGRRIGPGSACFIIAEAGVNHNGDPDLAKRLVDVAVAAGADAVKFQTFNAERLVSPGAATAAYQAQSTGERSQLELLRRLELSPSAHRQLREYCQARSIMFLSTPFDEESADLLETLGVPAFKVSSGDLTNTPLLAHIARKGKPVLLSTGMSTLDEVQTAVQTIRNAGGRQLVLLHCVSRYPAEPHEANLRAMQTLAQQCQVPVGYSDHTLGIDVALAAVALGACIIEKHLTLDRQLPGPDHHMSLDPGAFRSLVQGIRIVELSLGHGRKEPSSAEAEISAAARRSLVTIRPIAKGSQLTADAIAIKRPGTGLSPASLPQVVGRVAARDIAAGTLLSWDMVG